MSVDQDNTNTNVEITEDTDKALMDALELSDEDFMNLDYETLMGEADASPKEEVIEEKEEIVEGNTEPEIKEEVGSDIPEDSLQVPEETGTIESVEDSAIPEVKEEETPSEETVNYKEFYETLTAPFKASGKEIKVKNPEELIQLAQMGVDYTRKMQELAKHRKLLLSLEQQGMLDEERINFLIDVNKKNPEAIKKLIADAEIDPWDLTDALDEAPNYVPGQNIISDQEAALSEEIQSIFELPYGQDTLNAVKTWDDASKDAIVKEPQLLRTFREQQENGIFEEITQEIDRLKTVGTIPYNTPFIESYVLAGNSLFGDASNQQQQLDQQTQRSVPQPINTRLGNVNNKPLANNKAKSAAPPKKQVDVKPKVPNPLVLSDEEFMKSQHLYKQFLN